MKQHVAGQVSVTADKLRTTPEQAQHFFQETSGHIVNHLRSILSKVQGIETILMVGGFSESPMLQNAIRTNFPELRIIIPEDASMAVLMGAVIFGHNPSAIISRVSKFTYGVRVYTKFDPRVHPESRKLVIEGEEKCKVFDKHVEIDQEVYVGYASPEKSYFPSYKNNPKIGIKIFISEDKNPMYTDGCKYLGCVAADMSDIPTYWERELVVKLIYGNTELGVEARKKTGEVIRATMNLL